MKLQIPKIAGIAVVLLVAIVGGYFLLKGSYKAPTPVSTAPVAPTTQASGAEVKEITVSGTEYAFEPSTITLKAGEQVRLTFQNKGRIIHNLVIENLGISTKTIGGDRTKNLSFKKMSRQVNKISPIYQDFAHFPGDNPFYLPPPLSSLWYYFLEIDKSDEILA